MFNWLTRTNKTQNVIISPERAREDILLKLMRNAKYGVAHVLNAKRISSRIVQTVLAYRHISVVVRLKDITKLPTALGVGKEISLVSGFGDGTKDGPVNVVQNGNFLLYEFPIPREKNHIKLWKELYLNHPQFELDAVGVAMNQNQVKWVPGRPAHTLVLGMTDAGKTQLIRSMLFAAMRTHTPDELEFMICDRKGDFSWMEGSIYMKYSVARTEQEFRTCINLFNQELRDRHNKEDRKRKKMVIVIDEADYDWALPNKKNQQEMIEVANDGRTYGMFMLIGSHRANKDSLGGIPYGCENRYFGLVDSAGTSGTLYAGLNLHKLSGWGDFYHSTATTLTRFQAALVPDEWMLSLEKHSVAPLTPDLVEETQLVEAILPPKSGGRPLIQTHPAHLAAYLFYGPANISQTQARTSFRLKKTAHYLNRDEADAIVKWSEILKAQAGEFTAEQLNEIEADLAERSKV